MLRRERANAGFLQEGHVLFECDCSLHCRFSFLMCELFAVYQRTSTLLPGTVSTKGFTPHRLSSVRPRSRPVNQRFRLDVKD